MRVSREYELGGPYRPLHLYTFRHKPNFYIRVLKLYSGRSSLEAEVLGLSQTNIKIKLLLSYLPKVTEGCCRIVMLRKSGYTHKLLAFCLAVMMGVLPVFAQNNETPSAEHP